MHRSVTILSSVQCIISAYMQRMLDAVLFYAADVTAKPAPAVYV